jgi:divalent metal cation (Fe/Co/Zn/Cd) transporter
MYLCGDKNISMTYQDGRLYRFAFGLAVFTIVYNVLEGMVSLFFGISDESLTLAGFGADSLIEVISGIGILQMVLRIKNQGEELRSSFEKRALQITGAAFYLLVAGLVISAGYNLYMHHKPETTTWGVVISIISIVVMLVLLRMKLQVGKKLNSKAIIADAHCTRVCIYMSLILLISSAIFELTGFAWIDILGTFGLAWFSFTEGRECFEKARSGTQCTCHKT